MLRKLINIARSRISQSYFRVFVPNIESLMDQYVFFIPKPKPAKRILYVALKYDYGDKARGLSYEEYNFFYTLKNIDDIEVVYFDYYSICSKYGEIIANSMLKQAALLENVDTILCLLYKDYFDHDMLRELSEKYPMETILWVFDDDKRYEETMVLSQCFNKTVTTIQERYDQRLARGEKSCLAQFAANHYIYRNYKLPKIYDVVFIGQNFGNREAYVNYLKDNAIDVCVFGLGWSNGRLSQSKMIEIFNKSKIILNFSSSYGNPELKYIKGRLFEIPACGAFLLTEECNELDLYFDIGENIDIFSSCEELLDKVKYYLKHEKIRGEMASKGEQLVLNKYTFERYLREVLI